MVRVMANGSLINHQLQAFGLKMLEPMSWISTNFSNYISFKQSVLLLMMGTLESYFKSEKRVLNSSAINSYVFSYFCTQSSHETDFYLSKDEYRSIFLMLYICWTNVIKLADLRNKWDFQSNIYNKRKLTSEIFSQTFITKGSYL